MLFEGPQKDGIFLPILLLLLLGVGAYSVLSYVKIDLSGSRATGSRDSIATLEFQRDIVAPGFDRTLSAEVVRSPIGWGFMAPAVVEVNGDVFTLLLYPCPAHDKFFCSQILKNGNQWSPELNMAEDFLPEGVTVRHMHQNPILVRNESQLLVVYWIDISFGQTLRSGVNLIGIDITSPNPTWQKKSTWLSSPHRHMNYLGGALGPSGEILITGWLQNSETKTEELRLLRARPPAYQWEPATQVAVFSSKFHKPVYSQIITKPDGTIGILTTLGYQESCTQVRDATGNPITIGGYKDLVYYEGRFGQQFQAIWSDATADFLNTPRNESDVCLTNQRFPLDLLYDAAADNVYSISRNIDVGTNIFPPDITTRAAHLEFSLLRQQKKYPLRRNGRVIIDDLGTLFRPIFPTSNDIESISITIIDGQLVLIANGGTGRVTATQIFLDNPRTAVVVSTTMQQFSTPIEVPVPFGVGLDIQINQPNRNGSDTNKLFLWFSGQHSFQEATTNNFLKYRLLRYVVAEVVPSPAASPILSPTPTPTPLPSPTSTGPLACSPRFQTVRVGQDATLTASGGTSSQYIWLTPGNVHGHLTNGATVAVRYAVQVPNSRRVTLVQGTQQKNCVVLVVP